MKKKIPKKITLDSLEKSAIKYLEKYTVSEYQLIKVLRRKIIKTSFFYKTKPEKDFDLIKLVIKKFKEITNCPILVNTSFNVRGEPMVCTIEDAFRCFMGTNLDILVCESFILNKEEQNPDLLKGYKHEFERD